MIRYIKANIVDEIKTGQYDAAAHGCNCFCRMGAGVAKALTDEWPEIAVSDQSYKVSKKRPQGITEGDHNKMGNFSSLDLYKTTKNGRFEQVITIYNLYTQYRYGTDQRQIDYHALSMSLYKMYHDFRKSPTSLIIPKIGAGLAGGDWSTIENIIQARLPDTLITVCEL